MTPSQRTTVKRLAERGQYEPDTIHSILDEAPYCTVAFVHEGSPVAIPTIHARIGDTIYLHGSNASRMLDTLADGAEMCISVTLLDGLVLARSMFHSSMNYRSVVVFGRGRPVVEEEEKLTAMHAVSEHVVPGRWDEVRAPSPKEISGTRILAVKIDEASAKIRTGPPKDDEGDLVTDIWSGVVPLQTLARNPISERPALSAPASVRRMLAKGPDEGFRPV